MVSGLNSFSGLSGADIATLFGKVAPDAQTTDRAGIGQARNAGITGTQLIGANSNAATAIQTIVTQIQVEKMQANVQGKIATLGSASVSTTLTGIVPATADHRSVGISTTVLDLATTATADDLSGAVGMLMGKIKAEEAQVEATQDGQLMTRDQIVFAGHSSTTSVTWTSNSVTLNMKATENQGVELFNQENALSGIVDFTSFAQTFQARPATATPSSDPAASANPHGSALFLAITTHNSSFSSMADREQQIVSDFLNGALAGQNGQAAKDGSGFSYDWELSTGDEISHGVAGVMISNYDPSILASRDALHGKWSLSADEKSVAMDGDVVSKDRSSYSFQETLYVIIPLDNRS